MHSEIFKKHKLNKGFTLAEVLITLVIIGVIASMTIPAVINTYVESSTVSKVKKGLSILGQAKMLAENQEGPVTDWNFGEGASAQNAADFWGYLRPYISVAKDCGSSQNCYQSDGIYTLKNEPHSANYNTNSAYYKFVLADGSVMWFRNGLTGKCASTDGDVENVCAVFWIDVNGDKKPNTIGRDIFLYEFNPDGVYPAKENSCYKTSSGFGCAAYIIKNSNMKYLH